VADTETKLQSEFAEITGLDSTNQVTKFCAWLAERGCVIKNAQKGTLSAALRRKDLAPEARRAIELRRQLAHAPAAKIDSLRQWVMEDRRVRGTLIYHGAGTGRWSGRGPQPQNFKRDGERINEKIAAILAGGKDLESPVEAVGETARAMIRAADGHRLMIADFSGVESRVLAWIAGERSKIEAWETFDRTQAPADDPYFRIGRTIGHPEETARAAGKVADLAFGYQGGVGAYVAFAPEDDTADEQAIERYKNAWRSAHPATVKFWGDVDRAAVRAVRNAGTEHKVGRLTFCADEQFLRVTLPSGRAISYPFPRLELNRFDRPCVMFKDNAGGKVADCNFGRGAYGGLWTENIVSGIARDLLAAALIRTRGGRLCRHPSP
jgi:DNA polymerase bacteriophage-type